MIRATNCFVDTRAEPYDSGFLQGLATAPQTPQRDETELGRTSTNLLYSFVDDNLCLQQEPLEQASAERLRLRRQQSQGEFARDELAAGAGYAGCTTDDRRASWIPGAAFVLSKISANTHCTRRTS